VDSGERLAISWTPPPQTDRDSARATELHAAQGVAGVPYRVLRRGGIQCGTGWISLHRLAPPTSSALVQNERTACGMGAAIFVLNDVQHWGERREEPSPGDGTGAGETGPRRATSSTPQSASPGPHSRTAGTPLRCRSRVTLGASVGGKGCDSVGHGERNGSRCKAGIGRLPSRPSHCRIARPGERPLAESRSGVWNPHPYPVPPALGLQERRRLQSAGAGPD
jgi:hypothetical protein